MSQASDLRGTSLLSWVGRSWWVLLLYGLVAIGFGLIAVMRPLSAAAGLAWAIGVMALIEGEWLLIVSGLLAIVLGGMMFANPLGGVAVTTLWIGIGSLLYGFLQIAVAFRLRKLR